MSGLRGGMPCDDDPHDAWEFNAASLDFQEGVMVGACGARADFEALAAELRRAQDYLRRAMIGGFAFAVQYSAQEAIRLHYEVTDYITALDVEKEQRHDL